MLATSRIHPQEGPQKLFAKSAADIVIYGGAAGGGKTYSLLLEPLRYIHCVPGFEAAYFRRETPQFTNPGAAWDESLKMYLPAGGSVFLGPHEYRWPGGGKIKFSHLEHETTVYNWQGAQIALLLFDELTQFTQFQFWFMISRNRSTCGIRPYVRAACNPDADSWVSEFISWWIDPSTGFPIPERIGVLRYLVRGQSDALIWGDAPEELCQYLPSADQLPPGTEMPAPKSVTFIPAQIYDNPALLKANPEYLTSLLALPQVERERLLGGNWKIRPAAGLYFKRGWVQVVDAAPVMREVVRYWDLAATEKTEMNDPDWTVGVKLGRDAAGFVYVLDVVRDRVGPFEVETLLKNIASQDGRDCKIGWGKDPAQAGKFQTQHLARLLMGYVIAPEPESGDKITRFGPASAQCQAGNVKILRAPWNDNFFRVLEGFPDLTHDDDVDAFSGAFALMTTPEPFAGLLDFYAKEAADAKVEDRSPAV